MILVAIFLLIIIGIILWKKKRGYIFDNRLGLSRRDGKEKRSVRDRREGLVVGIVEKRKDMKNRRGGKERRSGKDRRRIYNPDNNSGQD